MQSTVEPNAHIERFVLSIKSECLDRMMLFGEQSLRHVVTEFVRHYHGERTIKGWECTDRARRAHRKLSRPVQVRQRLGGRLKYYYRDAA